MNLQYGDVSKEIRLAKQQTKIDVIDVPEIDKNDDLDGLSHLISACDYIVTIDNFIAHLAGALGKDTRVLLPKNNDWRWGQKEVSYWYKSVKLYHKDDKVGWQEHLEKINADITSNEEVVSQENEFKPERQLITNLPTNLEQRRTPVFWSFLSDQRNTIIPIA